MTTAEFAAAMTTFAPFEQSPRLAVAVSGGADSMCLAVLTQDWARERDGEAHCFVVDHGLRDGSGLEAERVAKALVCLGMPVAVLRWDHPPLDHALQQKARDARYALLDAAVSAWPALHLLMAHHADDQMETVAMRTARGSGAVGLSGMPAVTERARIRVIRPFLGLPKARLLRTLQVRGVRWVEDPSNHDRRFMRTRLRAERPSCGPFSGDPSARLRLDAATAKFLGDHATLSPFRRVRLDRAAFRSLPAEVGHHTLARLLASLSDRFYSPPPAALTRLQSAAVGDRINAATLGGCIVRLGQRWIRIRPEHDLAVPWRPPVAAAPAPFGASTSRGVDLASLVR
ncbi:MAG TPA: tRNA lysidine(34) synthetase TilS [Geminicoccus sp.]|nr:tRNA lysidine(34) synthetase TilS [Geminicoccus sp.]